jgi:hypothetical protein
VATVASFGDGAGIEAAFGSSGYPTALRVENGVVAASHSYAEVLPGRVPA